MFTCFRGKKNWDVEDETIFIRNGSMLLEKLISFCDGKYNPIRSFSEEELNRATNNYDRHLIIKDYGHFELYKGLLQDGPVIIKKFCHVRSSFLENIVDEIAFSSVFSGQKHVLKLLGCCLKTNFPIQVFEYVDNGTLADHILSTNRGCNVKALSWKCRLKIAVDVSTMIAYLHNEFPKPVIHKNILPSSILIDKDGNAKLADFSMSISIPEGEFELTTDKIVGKYGYMAPEYAWHGRYNEKIDVYSFGHVLFALLSGWGPSDFKVFEMERKLKNPSRNDMQTEESARDMDPSQNEMLIGEPLTDSDLSDNEMLPARSILSGCVQQHRLNEIVDNSILEEGTLPGKEQQLQAFATIAIQCLCEDVQNRLAIIDVAKQLREIYQSLTSSN